VLDGLGVCREDEQLYRALLARPDATTAELVADTGWAVSRVARHLRSLQSLGLAARTPGRPARYTPAVPEAAVEVLALRQQAAIVQARIGASVLAQEFRAAHRAGPFTVVRGGEAIAQRFYQAQQTAQSEVLILDKPPYAGALPERAPGLIYRTIYDMEALGDRAELAAARELATAGENCRILRNVPLKLVVTDRRTGLLQTGQEVVELGPSALLDGLVRLFELLWQQATPLWPEPEPSGPLSADDQRLLALAAAGLTDQAIARRLGVAQRTVERRMQRILKALEATTRFQAGLRAGHRGLL
jgi:DNA-binding CsgD family transcriptional regulator